VARGIDAEERFLSLVVANFDARRGRKRTLAGTNMNTFVSLSIALEIVALGLWAAVAAGSLLWMILSLLPVCGADQPLRCREKRKRRNITLASNGASSPATSARPSEQALSLISAQRLLCFFG
jgi:hypothetical protein